MKLDRILEYKVKSCEMFTKLGKRHNLQNYGKKG